MKPPDGEALRQLARRVDDMPELRGAGIGFIGDGRCVALRTSKHIPADLIRTSSFRKTKPARFQRLPPSIRAEALGLGINCAGAVLSWAALSGEAVAAPFTGGASLLLTVATVSAAGATTLQCAAAIFRTWDATFNKGELIRWMDSNEWYTWASEFLDGVSLLGAGLSTSATFRALQGVRRVTGRSFLQILKGMSRPERKRLTEEILRMQAVPLKTVALKDLIRAGKAQAALRQWRSIIASFCNWLTRFPRRLSTLAVSIQGI